MHLSSSLLLDGLLCACGTESEPVTAIILPYSSVLKDSISYAHGPLSQKCLIEILSPQISVKVFKLLYKYYPDPFLMIGVCSNHYKPPMWIEPKSPVFGGHDFYKEIKK